MECIASAVLPEQANELRDTFKNAGVPTEVTPDGCPGIPKCRTQKRGIEMQEVCLIDQVIIKRDKMSNKNVAKENKIC